jgi:DNA polymerase III epsilon subunit-like protein
MTWNEQPIHFVDFEGSLSSGILEFGVVTLLRGEISAARTRLCRPTGRIRREDTAVHGLDQSTLNPAAPFAEEFDYFAGLRATGPLAAHFAGAENSLIKSVWPYGRAAPDFARTDATTQEWGPWIDTGALYRQFYPQLASYGLAELISVCGLQPELDEKAALHCPAARRRYHAAPYDALAGAGLLCSLGRESGLAALTIPQLLAFSTLDGGKRDALQQGNLF